jgi:hypothetical protein
MKEQNQMPSLRNQHFVLIFPSFLSTLASWRVTNQHFMSPNESHTIFLRLSKNFCLDLISALSFSTSRFFSAISLSKWLSLSFFTAPTFQFLKFWAYSLLPFPSCFLYLSPLFSNLFSLTTYYALITFRPTTALASGPILSLFGSSASQKGLTFFQRNSETGSRPQFVLKISPRRTQFLSRFELCLESSKPAGNRA